MFFAWGAAYLHKAMYKVVHATQPPFCKMTIS
nr:MAG TPA: hypothetical protein [Bacteriophage sp.]